MVDTNNTDSTLLVDLNQQRLLSAIGVDAGTFLQGQLTCNIDDINPNISQLGAHCTPKGRMIADFRIARLADDHFALRVNTGVMGALYQSLSKYIVFSKAQLRDQQQDYKLIGLSGPAAQSLLIKHGGAAPTPINAVHSADGIHLINLGQQRFECWVQAPQSQSFWAALAPECEVTDTSRWDLLDIRDGLGQIREGTVELFIPQMLNYHIVGGISFSKGCYTGQEVIARMHYLGKSKRHMYRASIAKSDCHQAPVAGQDIYTQHREQSIGNVVLSAPADNQTFELLIVSTTKAATADKIFLDKERYQKLSLLTLPYAITDN